MSQPGFSLEEISKEISGVLAEIARYDQLLARNGTRLPPNAMSYLGEKIFMPVVVSEDRGHVHIWTSLEILSGHETTLPQSFHPSCTEVQYKLQGYDGTNEWARFTLII